MIEDFVFSIEESLSYQRTYTQEKSSIIETNALKKNNQQRPEFKKKRREGPKKREN